VVGKQLQGKGSEGTGTAGLLQGKKGGIHERGEREYFSGDRAARISKTKKRTSLGGMQWDGGELLGRRGYPRKSIGKTGRFKKRTRRLQPTECLKIGRRMNVLSRLQKKKLFDRHGVSSGSYYKRKEGKKSRRLRSADQLTPGQGRTTPKGPSKIPTSAGTPRTGGDGKGPVP